VLRLHVDVPKRRCSSRARPWQPSFDSDEDDPGIVDAQVVDYFQHSPSSEIAYKARDLVEVKCWGAPFAQARTGLYAHLVHGATVLF
jgi:hypothetical protein